MEYTDMLIPDYLKLALGNTEYSNAFFLFNHAVKKKEKGKGFTNIDSIDVINKVMKNNFQDDAINHLRAQERLIANIPGTIYRGIQTRVEQAMVVGLGYQNVMENSMTIHPIYGIPYVPGQSIKGIIRSWYINEKYGGDEQTALNDDIFCFIFGKEGKSGIGAFEGKVCFFDAFPVNKDIELGIDIINNHSPNYYKGKAVSDKEKPIPVQFAVVRDCELLFGFSVFKKDIEYYNSTHRKSPIVPDVFAEELQNNLLEILVYYGVGAKTAIGYGHFKMENRYKAISQKKNTDETVSNLFTPDTVYEVEVSDYCENPRYLKLVVSNSDYEGRITGAALRYKQKMGSHPWIGKKQKLKFSKYEKDESGKYMVFVKP